MSPALFNNDEAGRAAFKALADRAVEWIATYYSRMDSLPVRSQVVPGEIYQQFPDTPSGWPRDADQVFKDLDQKILPGITHWQHPNFYAFFPGNTSFPSIVAEMIISGIAAQCMLWESSPAAAELEQGVMEWCRDLLGLPAHWEGVIQDTASTATLTALLTAREWKSGFRISKRGFDQTTYRIYASAEAHSSIEKGVRLAGFGTDNLVKIAVDEKLALLPEKLEEVVRDDLSKGYVPVCVISTVGTTSTGAIDPVEAISKIASHFGLWHHVDAAYAGTALMLDEFAYLRSGLEGADSFVFNPHKWMFAQFDCSAYFVRDPELLLRTMRINPSYLQTDKGDAVHDYRDWGIPLGRRFRALKLWMVLELLGTNAIRDRLSYHIELAKKVEAWILDHPFLDMAYARSFNVNTFRIKVEYDPDGSLTKTLATQINNSGKAYMTHAVVQSRNLIRWVTGQTYTMTHHILQAMDLVDEHLNSILKK